MSTTTDKLALFKYDPSTDGAQTFNIQKALNDNWDKLDDAVKEILITLANKAPNGYGLGGEVVDAPKDSEGWPDANMITATGFYRAFRNLPYGGWNYVTHLQYGSTNALQFSAYASGETYALREKIQSVWGDWEYINPAMRAGIEYRTTERYLDKPVYVKVVDCGNCPESGHKDIRFDTSGVALPIRCYGNWTYDGRSTIPFETTGSDRMVVGIIGSFIRITTGGRNFSEHTCTVTVYYTKTTD